MTDETPHEDRTVIGVLAGKGGVGCSTVALNLAAITASSGRLTVLVDASPERRQLSFLADRTMSVPPEGLLRDRDDLLRMITKVAGGAHLVPPFPVTPSLLHAHLHVLFDVTLVDAPAGCDRLAIAAAVDHILVVTTPLRPALRETSRLLDLLTAAGLRDRVRCLLNRTEPGAGAGEAAVRDALGDVTLQLPYDPSLLQAATDAGIAVAEQDPGSHLARRMRAVAASLGLVSADDGAEADALRALPQSWDGGIAGDSARLGGDRRGLDRRLRFRRR